MFRLIGRIPKTHFHLACSGGSDSMIFVDFLQRYPKHKFDLLYFNHGTECCTEAQKFVEQYGKEHNIKVHVGYITEYPEKQKTESQEEYWRNCRYEFLSKFKSEPIIMCHHLNDVIETWVMTCMSGKPNLIPYYNPKYNIIRPFLCVSKKQIKESNVFKTTKGEGHGYGLIRIDSIIKKLDGYLSRNSEDGAFTTEILIPQI